MFSPSRSGTALVAALGLIFVCGVPARAQTATTGIIEGVVDDGATGLPVGGATVLLVGRGVTVTAAGDGAFRIAGLAAGVYRLRVERSGYQPVLSNDLALVAGADVRVTLALQRASAGTSVRVIGATATNAAAALLRATTTSRTLNAEALEQRGVTRAGDAVRELPGITNGITGDTASLGDDIPLQVRGIAQHGLRRARRRAADPRHDRRSSDRLRLPGRLQLSDLADRSVSRHRGHLRFRQQCARDQRNRRGHRLPHAAADTGPAGHTRPRLRHVRQARDDRARDRNERQARLRARLWSHRTRRSVQSRSLLSTRRRL